MDINIARDLIAQTDEVSYYLGLGMSLWYTGTEEYIEGRNCPVFVIGTDHEEHFTKEKSGEENIRNLRDAIFYDV